MRSKEDWCRLRFYENGLELTLNLNGRLSYKVTWWTSFITYMELTTICYYNKSNYVMEVEDNMIKNGKEYNTVKPW